MKVAFTEKQRSLYDHRQHRVELEPTGYLLFEIKDWIEGVKGTWLETETDPHEEAVPEIVGVLLLALHFDKERRLRREAEHLEYERQRRLDLERQRNSEREQTRWDSLVAHAKAWKERELVREFLEKCKDAGDCIAKLDPELSHKAMQDWLRSRLET